MLILPAIDLLDGECVRLVQGDYSEKTSYTSDPISVAKRFEDQGATWMHIVDLDGARSGQMLNLKIVNEIASSCNLKIEFGGGVRSMVAALTALEAGVSRIVIGSKVIQDPEAAQELFQELGERAVAGLDARAGRVAVSGWTQTSDAPVTEVARRVEAHGARRIVLTDIAKDGMLQGPNIGLLESVLGVTTIPVIQSGGISTLDDLRLLLDVSSRVPEGVIIGKAIYENRIDLGLAIEKFQTEAQQPTILNR
jgi:phosphoribosylformimino-5-aminoimidazole carboxamide ribotide isomerase